KLNIHSCTLLKVIFDVGHEKKAVQNQFKLYSLTLFSSTNNVINRDLWLSIILSLSAHHLRSLSLTFLQKSMVLRDIELVRLSSLFVNLRHCVLNISVSNVASGITVESKSLKTLNLHVEAAESILIKCDNLRELDITNEISTVIKSPRLQLLSCSHINKFSKISFQPSSLEVQGSKKPMLSSLNQLDLKNIREMNISKLLSSDFDVINLTHLNLSISVLDHQFNNDTFQHLLNKCRKLIKINVESQHGMSQVVLSDMRDLSCVRIKSATLRTVSLNKLPKLTSISLHFCDSFHSFVFEPQVSPKSLPGTRTIQPAAISPDCFAPNLLFVDLRLTAIGNFACCRLMSRCPKLICIRVDFCKKLTTSFKTLLTKANQNGDFDTAREKGELLSGDVVKKKEKSSSKKKKNAVIEIL
ncbi:hypothetical protein AKO1_005411, partial [Acrasis kona]